MGLQVLWVSSSLGVVYLFHSRGARFLGLLRPFPNSSKEKAALLFVSLLLLLTEVSFSNLLSNTSSFTSPSLLRLWCSSSLDPGLPACCGELDLCEGEGQIRVAGCEMLLPCSR